MPREGTTDLASLGGSRPLPVGRARDFIKEKVRDYLDIEPVDLLPESTLTDLVDRVTKLTSEHNLLSATLTDLKNGAGDYPLVKKLNDHGIEIGGNIKNIQNLLGKLGSADGFTSCYDNDVVIALDKDHVITLTGTMGTTKPGTTTTDPTAPDQNVSGPTSGITTNTSTLPQPTGLGRLGQRLQKLQSPSNLFLQDVGTPSSGDSTTTTFTTTRHPFKSALKSIMDGKPIYCQMGFVARRMDLLNQQIGGLETKIPAADVIDKMKSDLSTFTKIYALIRDEFKFGDPTVWFKDIESTRKAFGPLQSESGLNRANITSLGTQLTGFGARITSLEENLTSEIDKRIGSISIPKTTWDAQVGSRLLNFDYTTLKDKDNWNSALDSWLGGHKISALGGITLKERLDGIVSGRNQAFTDTFSDMKALVSTVASIDLDLSELKKKFNTIRSDVGTRFTDFQSLVGSGSGLGLRGSLRTMLVGVKDKFENFLDGRGIVMVAWYANVDCIKLTASILDNLGSSADVVIEAYNVDDTIPSEKTINNITFKKKKTRTFDNPREAIVGVRTFAGDIANALNSNCTVSTFKTNDILGTGFTATGEKMIPIYEKQIANLLAARLKEATDGLKDTAKNPEFGKLDGGLKDIFDRSKVTLPAQFTDLDLRSKLPTGFLNLFKNISLPLSMGGRA